MQINLLSKLIDPSEKDFEIVECKGRGHPDTLSDRLAEKLSCAYSQLTKKKYGTILRHQFDKLALMGGKCDVRFGGGNFKSPIRLLINGRATPRIGDEDIFFRDVLVQTSKDFLQSELRNFDFLTDCKVIIETSFHSTRGMIDNNKKGTSPIHFRFRPRTLNDLPEHSKPLSNDTALGCAFAPFTALENLVLAVEKGLTSDDARSSRVWMGTDVKIMAYRIKDVVNVTVSVPQISSEVNSVSEYKSNYETTLQTIKGIVDGFSEFKKINISLNPGDDPNLELLYLRFTGSCIESGDEGLVGRGNRIGGIISSNRPFSIEALNGKNPAYHAGKIYSAAAWEIANAIWQKYQVSCEVFIASQIDRPLNDPWLILLNTSLNVNEVETKKICEEILFDISKITNGILEGKYPLV